MWEWIEANWGILFGGVGTAIVGFVLTRMFRAKAKNDTSVSAPGKRTNAVNAGGDVNLSTGSTATTAGAGDGDALAAGRDIHVHQAPKEKTSVKKS